MNRNLVLLVVTVGILSWSLLNAWERSAFKLCNKNEQECLKNARLCSEGYSECKQREQLCIENVKQCLETSLKNDEISFSTLLNTYYFDKFEKFNSDQKQKAMDYADNNKMTPNDAVAEVLAIPHEM